ncbi:MAG: ComEC/Rec2 family competence protein [Bacteroidetes bacterium]|nr:ComEC/Rec2 family competence protein [Fibrella sp.]
MKGYPFVRYVGALISGILLYVALPGVGWLPVVAGLTGVVLWLMPFIRTARQPLKPISVQTGMGVLLLLVAAGWVTAYIHTATTRSDNISHLAGLPDAYEAVVDNLPEERAKTYRVELKLRRGRVQHRYRSVTGRVIVYLDKADQPMPRYGEVWLVSGAPRPIDPPLNPGEFNYQRFLSYKGIYHQQYLRAYQRRVLDYAPPNQLTALANTVNRLADSVFTRQVGSRPEYAIVNAMILGVRDDLDTDLYKAYSAAGAVHILSVSGLHVGILFFVLTWVIGLFAKNRQHSVGIAALKLAILWFYALMTGFSPPVLRSAMMFSLLIVAETSKRPHSLPNTLGASAFFILCFDPYALFSAGFQLSYLAVAGIGAWVPALDRSVTSPHRWQNWLWKLTAVAVVAQLITFPLGVFYFHQFPTYFLLANPVVMLLSQVLLPLAMATLAFCWVPYLNDALGWLLQKVAFLLNNSVTQVGQLPGARWDGLWLSPPEMALVYLVMLSGVALLLTRQRAWLWLTCGLSFTLALLTIHDELTRQSQQRLAVHFIPHKTAVSLTDGPASVLLTDLDVRSDPRSFDFYLKNTFGQWGIARPTVVSVGAPDTARTVLAYHQTRDYALWVWHGKTLLLVNKLTGRSRWRLPAVVDYLIIRRNALRDWDQLNGRVVARKIIFDDSSKTPLTDKLLAEARQRGIVCYSVRQMGAFIEEFE